jgi:hypothetical protein
LGIASLRRTPVHIEEWHDILHRRLRRIFRRINRLLQGLIRLVHFIHQFYSLLRYVTFIHSTTHFAVQKLFAEANPQNWGTSSSENEECDNSTIFFIDVLIISAKHLFFAFFRPLCRSLSQTTTCRLFFEICLQHIAIFSSTTGTVTLLQPHFIDKLFI